MFVIRLQNLKCLTVRIFRLSPALFFDFYSFIIHLDNLAKEISRVHISLEGVGVLNQTDVITPTKIIAYNQV